MRSLTVDECDLVAGGTGVDVVIVTGTYTGGGTQIPWWEWQNLINCLYNYCYSFTLEIYTFVGQVYQQAETIVQQVDEIDLEGLAEALEAGAVSLDIGEQILEVPAVAAGIAEATIQRGIDDVHYFRQTDAHVPDAGNGVIAWQDLQIDWSQWGADDPELADYEVFLNWINWAMREQ